MSGTLKLPARMLRDLEGYGPWMLRQAETVRTAWLQECHLPAQPKLASTPVTVGTDCSGCEAPIFSLRAMGISFRHCFACDNAPHAETFIRAVTKPEVFLSDMLARSLEDLPAPHIYVCGFPCKPYSSLHNDSKGFKEKAAKPFKAMLETAKKKRPCLAVFENVLGLMKYMPKVRVDMQRELHEYIVLLLQVCPTEFGFPARRPRFYFVAVRQDMCITQNPGQLADFARKLLESFRKPVPPHLADYLLPSNTQCVLEEVSGSKGPKPAQKNAAPAAASLPFNVAGLTAKQTEVLKQTWVEKVKKQGKGNKFVADVSQSLQRKTVALDGKTPCVTPGSKLFSGELNRLLCAEEKMLLSALPMHRISVPQQLTKMQLHSLAGNTMHCACVAGALLCGMSLLRLGALKAAATNKPAKTGRGVWVDLTRAAKKATRKKVTLKASKTPALKKVARNERRGAQKQTAAQRGQKRGAASYDTGSTTGKRMRSAYS
ncbi:unnamed protein product [Symbiodinium natans]|uniref:DNA (cytosine-5-)-methyltransferase n=1 Tax=Symbiodinium natans TaxID=878477 RepID=A0A812TL04_9DINO|nr:unnamed protein product [Symbiodinium natans]CAE7530137.1 unnamed protein product [Symbiodinium natans]